MIAGLVCARAGSEGLPGKNLLQLGGVSLIDVAIEKAMASEYIDAVVVNTDIDVDVRDWVGAPKTIIWCARSPELAGSRAGKWPVFRESIRAFEKFTSAYSRIEEDGKLIKASAMIDIDVSRPLTTAIDVDSTFVAYMKSACPVMLAIGHGKKSPYFDIYEYDKAGNLNRSKQPRGNLVARQDGPPVWYYGGIMIADRSVVYGVDDMWDVPVGGHEIPEDHCHDVDYPTDWLLIEALHGQHA
jgi:CMP-N-acetylneuraminic acid synthetase